VTVLPSAKGQTWTLAFKVAPASGLHINLEGPWRLDITSSPGLKVAKASLLKLDMDEKLPGFIAKGEAAVGAKGGQLEYKLIAFVCTDDKSRCYRDVHTGKATWGTP
jgi:hypothetical protein